MQVRRRITARELARRLEVSERTIHRDMEALSTAGVPVVAERGVGGGWRLLEEYRTNLTGLNDVEIQALFLTKPPRLLADLGLDKASEAALIKLLAALPSGSRRSAEDVRQRIHVDTAGWRKYEEPVPCLPIIQETLRQERRLRFTYARAGGEAGVERVVDPLALVAKGSVWYLVAAVAGEPRTYRVSRIQTAEALDEPCVRPKDFDIAAYWERSSADFQANIPRFEATLRVHPDVTGNLRAGERYTRVVHEHPPDADGWVRMEVIFEGEHNAAEYILAYADRIEVLAPAALRAVIIAAAERVLALYAARSRARE
jgi:predicted DNA-binding transcriptional regulator YafY